ncbi:hypothetical protein MHYP_G00129530 [Metynnis hypsauchen]
MEPVWASEKPASIGPMQGQHGASAGCGANAGQQWGQSRSNMVLVQVQHGASVRPAYGQCRATTGQCRVVMGPVQDQCEANAFPVWGHCRPSVRPMLTTPSQAVGHSTSMTTGHISDYFRRHSANQSTKQHDSRTSHHTATF